MELLGLVVFVLIGLAVMSVFVNKVTKNAWHTAEFMTLVILAMAVVLIAGEKPLESNLMFFAAIVLLVDIGLPYCNASILRFENQTTRGRRNGGFNLVEFMLVIAIIALIAAIVIPSLAKRDANAVDMDQYKKCVLNRSMVVMSAEETDSSRVDMMLYTATNQEKDPWMVVFVMDDGTLKPGMDFVAWAKRQQGYVQKPPIEDPQQMVK